MGNKKQFDYYIFIDYSEELIGYIVIRGSEINEILSKIVNLKHYKEVKNKKEYLKSIKKIFEKNHLYSYLSLVKICEIRKKQDIYLEIKEFINSHKNNSIFLSVDDKQKPSFDRFFAFTNLSVVKILKEGRIIRNSTEYKLNLIIDNLLNIVRSSLESKKK